MNIRKHIPNTITCLNLVAGCIAVVMALKSNLQAATIWIIIAAVLDFLDGLAARLLKAYSPIGKDLDSLADIVSFGVAPGMMVFMTLQKTTGFLSDPLWQEWIPWLAFIIPAFSGLRLAKFNNDTRQTTSFIGLPVPAHTLLWAGICYSVTPVVSHYPLCLTLGIIGGAMISSWLMVSEIPMFSLKIKSLAWKGNELRYILLISALLFTGLFGFIGLSATIILYILFSVISAKRAN